MGGLFQIVQGLLIRPLLHKIGEQQQKKGGGKQDHQIKEDGVFFMGVFVLRIVLERAALVRIAFGAHSSSPLPAEGAFSNRSRSAVKSSGP